MKTLSTTLLFCLAVAGLLASLRADALSSPRIEPGLSRPEPLSLRPDDGKGGGDGDDKGDGKDDEEDEEDYRARYTGISGAAALELVDPGVLDDLMRLRAAARYARY
ncbi:hypothetical protein [Myxococcus stipitatus]|uniref:hypothetical protein n=1 Tax=Myxococcus stipitatus TaxID=83455 RepID=UPI0030D01300